MCKKIPTYAGLHNILQPCECGSVKIWVVTYGSFLKRRYEVECPYCERKTEGHWFKRRAIKSWNACDKK